MARRTVRHPDTGHEVALRVEREVGDGEEPRWRVTFEETLGAPAWMARLRHLAEGTHAQARRDFSKRQRALRTAGYEPVVERMHTEVR
jgi:hypothetical protein